MRTEKQLLQILNDNGIDCYEMASEINEDVAIQLVDFEQLFLFLKKHNIDTVFYRFEFPSADVLQITEDVLSELHIDDDIIEVMKKDFEETMAVSKDVTYDYGDVHPLRIRMRRGILRVFAPLL